MKRSTITLTALGFAFMAAAATGAAMAQQDQPSRPGPGWSMSAEDMAARHAEMFKALDANGDGTVSQEEYANRDTKKMEELREKHQAERRAAHFAAMDTDKNGTVSQEEWQAAKRDGMGGGKGGPCAKGEGDMPRGMGPNR